MKRWLLIAALVAPGAGIDLGFSLGDIKHFLVIFFENRSFDHIFGCATKELPGIDGVTAGMGNWRDPNDHSKGFVNVGCGKAEYVCSHDEDHSFPGYKKMIFGADETVGAQAPYPNATMSGFANHSEPSMEAFAPEQLPVKIALAKEFGVFNNFYAALPGPSQPNHMFAQSGTSCGATETGVVFEQCGGVLPLFPQKTIYESLLENGHDFKVYYNGTIAQGGVPGDIYVHFTPPHLHSHATPTSPPLVRRCRACSRTSAGAPRRSTRLAASSRLRPTARCRRL
jgi:phospholipase C